jgi:hypothetical protein
MSPTGRTLEFLRAGGFLAAVVETWIPKLERRRDLWGGFDVIGVDVLGKSVWLIQCTSLANVSTRVRKLQGLPAVPKLLAAGIRCEVWGWFKLGDHWDCRRVELRGADCEPVEMGPRRRRGRQPKQATLFD